MTTRCQVNTKRVHVNRATDLARLCKEHAPGTVTPKSTVTGDCGYSYLYIYDLGSGTAGISVGAHSTKGDIDFGSASIH